MVRTTVVACPRRKDVRADIVNREEMFLYVVGRYDPCPRLVRGRLQEPNVTLHLSACTKGKNRNFDMFLSGFRGSRG